VPTVTTLKILGGEQKFFLKNLQNFAKFGRLKKFFHFFLFLRSKTRGKNTISTYKKATKLFFQGE